MNQDDSERGGRDLLPYLVPNITVVSKYIVPRVTSYTSIKKKS